MKVRVIVVEKPKMCDFCIFNREASEFAGCTLGALSINECPLEVETEAEVKNE